MPRGTKRGTARCASCRRARSSRPTRCPGSRAAPSRSPWCAGPSTDGSRKSSSPVACGARRPSRCDARSGMLLLLLPRARPRRATTPRSLLERAAPPPHKSSSTTTTMISSRMIRSSRARATAGATGSRRASCRPRSWATRCTRAPLSEAPRSRRRGARSTRSPSSASSKRTRGPCASSRGRSSTTPPRSARFVAPTDRPRRSPASTPPAATATKRVSTRPTTPRPTARCTTPCTSPTGRPFSSRRAPLKRAGTAPTPRTGARRPPRAAATSSRGRIRRRVELLHLLLLRGPTPPPTPHLLLPLRRCLRIPPIWRTRPSSRWSWLLLQTTTPEQRPGHPLHLGSYCAGV
mmetsp:Transcript_14871/g.59617  ORF Transcript_14871/g.59617 Transcript_14871/m.59617 type:complete len:349 (+) Transcript_14871:133-1179(+)